MLGGFFNGASYALRGLRWTFKPRLRRWVVIPLAINTSLFALATWLLVRSLGGWMDRLFGDLPWWLAWLDWLRFLVWPLFAIAMLLVAFYGFTLIANLIASPFNDKLSSKVASIVRPSLSTAEESETSWKEIVMAPMGELRKLGYFGLRALPLLILFLIPGLNLAAPFLWALFSAWMLALEYADYPFGNQHVKFPDQRKILSSKRMTCLGFGAGILLMTIIPILNFLSMPAAVIGATLMWSDHFAGGGERDI